MNKQFYHQKISTCIEIVNIKYNLALLLTEFYSIQHKTLKDPVLCNLYKSGTLFQNQMPEKSTYQANIIGHTKRGHHKYWGAPDIADSDFLQTWQNLRTK